MACNRVLRKTFVHSDHVPTSTVKWVVLKNKKFSLEVLHTSYLYFIYHLSLLDCLMFFFYNAFSYS